MYLIRHEIKAKLICYSSITVFAAFFLVYGDIDVNKHTTHDVLPCVWSVNDSQMAMTWQAHGKLFLEAVEGGAGEICYI